MGSGAFRYVCLVRLRLGCLQKVPKFQTLRTLSSFKNEVLRYIYLFRVCTHAWRHMHAAAPVWRSEANLWEEAGSLLPPEGSKR